MLYKLRLRPIWQSSEFFSSNYFQIGQHVVLLHILMLILTAVPFVPDFTDI